MRLINALKHLLKNYRFIMPTYLFSLFTIFFVSHIAPVIGTILILPISVGVSYVMLQGIVEHKKRSSVPLTIGFRKSYYAKNLFYLFIRQLLFLSPIFIGTLIAGIVFGLFSEPTVHISIVIFNLLLFAFPAAIVSLMLAMVPFLLADQRFDQRKHNPLKVSASIMRGNYLKLIFIRMFFLPWLALQSSGIILILLTYYRQIFGGSGSSFFILPTIFIAPLVYLLFTPWYHMMHAELYVTLRHKVKKYR